MSEGKGFVHVPAFPRLVRAGGPCWRDFFAESPLIITVLWRSKTLASCCMSCVPEFPSVN